MSYSEAKLLLLQICTCVILNATFVLKPNKKNINEMIQSVQGETIEW